MAADQRGLSRYTTKTKKPRSLGQLTHISQQRRDVRMKVMLRCLATGAIGYFSGKLLAHVLGKYAYSPDMIPKMEAGASGKASIVNAWDPKNAFDRYCRRLNGIISLSTNSASSVVRMPKYIGIAPLAAAALGFVGILVGTITVPSPDKDFLRQNPPATHQEWADAQLKAKPVGKIRVGGVDTDDGDEDLPVLFVEDKRTSGD